MKNLKYIIAREWLILVVSILISFPIIYFQYYDKTIFHLLKAKITDKNNPLDRLDTDTTQKHILTLEEYLQDKGVSKDKDKKFLENDPIVSSKKHFDPTTAKRIPPPPIFDDEEKPVHKPFDSFYNDLFSSYKWFQSWLRFFFLYFITLFFRSVYYSFKVIINKRVKPKKYFLSFRCYSLSEIASNKLINSLKATSRLVVIEMLSSNQKRLGLECFATILLAFPFHIN